MNGFFFEFLKVFVYERVEWVEIECECEGLVFVCLIVGLLMIIKNGG